MMGMRRREYKITAAEARGGGRPHRGWVMFPILL